MGPSESDEEPGERAEVLVHAHERTGSDTAILQHFATVPLVVAAMCCMCRR